MTRPACPSDLSDAQWQLIEPVVPTPKAGGRPATISWREIVNGVLYVEDLESMNGTWLDGRKLEAHRPAPLRPGSIVEFGKIKLRVTAG